MKQAFRAGLRIGLLAASLAGIASAQDIASNQKPEPTTRVVRAVPAVEPADLSGMLAAQNQVRERLGLPKLAWSADLAHASRATAADAADGACSMASTGHAVRGKDVSIYWAAGLRRLGGEDTAQDISPSYVVAQWRAGQSTFDAATSACRNSSAECAAYSRIVAPSHREVGCARHLCSSQAQLWICEYGQ